MFDVGSGGSDIGVFDSGNDGTPERRQYTLKGVETDTIRLMRYAASREGMKIGSWVSLRMREAAEKALAKDNSDNNAEVNLPRANIDNESHYQRNGSVSLDAFEAIQSAQMALDARLTRIEDELRDLASGQRTILSAIVSNLCSK
ncbi:hypothetical protein [Sphingobium sp. B12D2B]|uniref:hypothetical protein n=1 Tax=Sphingobium sp. B12D2B TaxID=2940577 RepID=UPI0022249D86|nr:hypothetical protein [Sphingobium sp. B12D2B]MCW2351203.1 hypothetical protein [Sphingobium sp. B12D2B]